MGAIASGMLLYGMSMIYGATGSIDIAVIAKAIAATPLKQSLILSFGLVFLVVGIGFKLAAVPFHMWAPDVYQGAPSSVAALIASAPKLAAFGMAVRILVLAMPHLLVQWQQLLIVMAILSMGLGNLIAIMQSNIKRMLAYSGISHIGYMFLGLLAGTTQGYNAALFYMITYAIMSVGALGMVALLSRGGIELENIDDFRGLNSRNPWRAFLMMLLLFSMAGVPPSVGFFAKLFVLSAVINTGFIWIAVLALLFAVIGAYYYIRVVKVMYFDSAHDLTPIPQSFASQAVMSVNGLAVLALGIFPGVVLHFCKLVF